MRGRCEIEPGAACFGREHEERDAGAGFFGADLGMLAPVMTLMLHVAFGIVLGAVYALERLVSPRALQGARTERASSISWRTCANQIVSSA
jgi:hypothetical protein